MKQRNKIVTLLLVTLMLLAVFAGCGESASAPEASEQSAEPAETTAGQSAGASAEQEEKVFNLKLSENQTEDNPCVQGMYKFAELANEKTNGTVNIEVYPNGTLGDETACMEQVMAGALDMMRINSVTLSTVVKDLETFTLPYVFTDFEHKYRVLNGEIGQEVLDACQEYGMVGLAYVESGFRNFYTTETPIRSVEDMKGLKIRVQKSEIAIKMVELLGANPTPMDYSEVFQSLQTGVIDGAENDFVSYNVSGHYEVAKYMALDGHMSPPGLVIINKELWDSMSETQQEAVQEAAIEACLWQQEAMNDYQLESREKAEASGCEMIDVDVEEFQEAMQPIYEMYPDSLPVLERMKALQ